jgi:hypothetical protein
MDDPVWSWPVATSEGSRMKQIPFGSTVKMRATFRDYAKALFDPTSVKVVLRPRVDEDYVPEEFVYGSDPELIRESAGAYKLVWVPPTPGGWLYRWEGTGAGVHCLGQGSFMVADSRF